MKNHRVGYTLMEVLLATALTSFLMLAVYAALDLYWTTRRAGRENIARAQVARAVLRIMAADIRSVVFILPNESDLAMEESTEPEDDSDTDDTMSDDSGMLDETGEELLPELTLYGDASSLVLRASRPVRSLDYMNYGEGLFPGARLGDLVEIRYLLADAQSGELGAAIAAQTDFVPLNPSSVGGLARTEVDAAVADLGDATALVENARILAPEISFLQFTYLDGTEILDAWDSSLMGRLPSAVEITIGFRSEEQLTVSETLSGVGQTPVRTYRLVVALPLAQPYVPQEEL